MNKRRPKDWEKYEEKVLGDKDGFRLPGSGACTGLKGDIRINSKNKYLVECKCTSHEGFRVTNKLWKKILKEALEAQRIPVLAISIDGISLVVCAEELFWELNDG